MSTPHSGVPGPTPAAGAGPHPWVADTDAVIVFDLGGVLLRWQPLMLIQACLPAHAPDEAAARALAATIFQSFVPGADWSEFDRGALPLPDLVPRLAARSGLAEAEVRTLVEAIPGHLQLQAGTLGLIEDLKAAGHRVHFLSNMPAPYAAHLEARDRISSLFDSGLYSCDIGLVKPDAAIFHAAVERLGLKPGRTVFIDDHPANVASARACGWQALQFTDAAACRADLARVFGLPAAPARLAR